MHFAGAVLLLAAVLPDGPSDVASEPKVNVEVAPATRFDLEARLGARAGASAGHVWVTPFAFALPGAGGDVKLGFRMNDGWSVDGRIALSVGIDESGTLGGGYRGNTGVAYEWFNAEWSALSTRLFVGLSSISLIPVPGVGSTTTLSFTPVRLSHFRWTVDLDGTFELLVIVPRLVLGAQTAVHVDLGDFSLGLQASGAAEGAVAVVANVVSATAGIALVTSYRF